jgi:hypothetical protein
VAYPNYALGGAGQIQFHHAWWAGNYEFPHPATIDLTFRAERFDGGPTSKTVIEWDENGNMKNRVINTQDGWRPILTLGWGHIDADVANRLRAFISVCNLSTLPLRIQPHDDVEDVYNMIYDTSAELRFGSPGNMYLGHAPSVRFIGVELVTDISGAIGSGTALADAIYPLIF